jgi:membrane associated rhomboid family serine protease
MVSFVIFGVAVETLLGRVRFVSLYLLAALGGSVCSYLISPANELGVGASGAIFGLMGAYFVLARKRRLDTSMAAMFIVINLMFSFIDPGIDWRAHVGGLIVGSLVAAIYNKAEDLDRRTMITTEIIGSALVLALLCFLVTLPPGHVNIGW